MLSRRAAHVSHRVLPFRAAPRPPLRFLLSRPSTRSSLPSRPVTGQPGCYGAPGVTAAQWVTRSGTLGPVEVLAVVELGSLRVVLRRAAAADVPAIVRLLAADPIAAAREGVHAGEDLAGYQRAFRAVDSDPAHILVVGQAGPEVVATMQVSFIPGMSHRGALRAQVEAVEVDNAYQGRGLGAAMMNWAIGEARQRGCGLVQLTSDKSRTSAHRFYQRLGFVPSHEGMKLAL
jgi:GNAT superfamily N-acetyltransferase